MRNFANVNQVKLTVISLELFKNLRINWPLPIIRKSLRSQKYKLWKNGRNFLQFYLFSTCTYAYWWHCKLNDRDMHTYSIVSVRDIKEEERFSMWMKNNVLSRNQLKPIIFDILFFQFMRLKRFNDLSCRISIHICKNDDHSLSSYFSFMFGSKQLK